MPVVNHSSYNSPIWLRNGHLQTIWPVLFRNPPLPSLWRERLETPDGDFIDIDHIPACAGHPFRACGHLVARARRKQHAPVHARHGRSAQPPRMGCGGPEFQGLLRRNEPHASALPRRGNGRTCTLSCSTASPSATGASYLWGSAWAAIKRSSISGRRDPDYPFTSKRRRRRFRPVRHGRRGGSPFRCPPGLRTWPISCGRCGGRSKKNIPASPIASISTGSTASVRSANSTIAIPPR